MAELVFWASFVFVLYVYIGYPLLITAWKRIAGKPVHKASCTPKITLIVVAYNEKANIRRKIENCLALDYPGDRIEILVSLDGPTDGTDVLMFKLAGRGIHLLY